MQEKQSQEKPYCFSARRAGGMGNKLVSVDGLMMAASAGNRWCLTAAMAVKSSWNEETHPPTHPSHTLGILLPISALESEIRMLHVIQKGMGCLWY